MKTAFVNAKIITGDQILEDGVVVVDGARICQAGKGFNIPLDAKVIDAQGHYLSPGFIDLHVHGGGGHDVMEAQPMSVVKMARAHVRFGTTSMLPTTLTASLEDIRAAIYAVDEAMKMPGGESILGIHLEGPYLAHSQAGAQNAKYMICPSPKEYEDLVASSKHIRMMGIAPELPGAHELGCFLRGKGIVASISHSDATYDECMEAVRNGFTDITHIYSGCSTVRRINAFRVAGVVEAGLVSDDLTVQVIGDGKHLPASLLKLIFKCKGAHGISLITDGLSFSAHELEEGVVYRQGGGVESILENGVMMMLDRQAFAGSIATMNSLVRNMTKLAGVSLVDAVRTATTTPAKVIGMDKCKGSIGIGLDADIVLMDSDFQVLLTMVGGEVKYSEM